MRILSFFLFIIAFTGCTDQSTAQTKLAPNDFEAKIKADPSVQIVDVRTPEEFAEGHLEGAVNYNFYSDDFEQNIAKLDRSRPVLVYCAVGGRSASAAEKFVQKGFPQVYDLAGGIKAWIAQRKKTVQ